MPFFRALTPGYRITYTGLNVEDGLLYMICWAGTPDTPIGNAGPSSWVLPALTLASFLAPKMVRVVAANTAEAMAEDV
mgnify:CR=1 FL=1